MRAIDVLTAPWAIEPAKLLEICAIYSTHLRGEKIDIERIEAKLGRPLASEDQGYVVDRGVALVPVDGPIAKRMNLFTRISGGASTQLIERDIRGALADQLVKAIVLVVDSPGGTVDGTQDLARIVHLANEEKPVVTFASGTMASGAYWIGAAADRAYISSETDIVGSIGVVATHVDMSEYEKKIGIKTTEIYAGKYKRIASSYAPLSEDGRQSMQDMVDYLYSVFVADVAKFRGVSEEQVLKNMADGRLFVGQQAVTAGLVDGVSTLDDVIAQLAAGTYGRKRGAAGSAAGATSKAGAGAAPNAISIHSQEDNTMDKATIERDHPAIAKAFRDEGIAAGADAERNRIKSVQEQGMPGHEKLIAALAFDGKTTGPEAAVQVLNAERGANKSRAVALEDDAPRPAPHAAAPAAPAPASDAGKTPEERARAAWDKDANLRAEYGDDLDTYLAFEKNRNNVRILGRRAA